MVRPLSAKAAFAPIQHVIEPIFQGLLARTIYIRPRPHNAFRIMTSSFHFRHLNAKGHNLAALARVLAPIAPASSVEAMPMLDQVLVPIALLPAIVIALAI